VNASTGRSFPFRSSSGSTTAAPPSSETVRAPTTTWPGSAAVCRRAATLMVSPIALKLCWPAAPTFPTSAAPAFAPARKRGQPGRRAAVSAVAACMSTAARTARSAWSGWSTAALKTTMTASPAKRSIRPPCSRTTTGSGHAPVLVEHRDHLGGRRALGEGREALEIGEEDADRPLDAAEAPDGAVLAQPFSELLGHVWAEQLVDVADLCGGALEQDRLVRAETEAPGHGACRLVRVAALVGLLRERRERAAVVVVDTRDRVLEVDARERALGRGLAAVFLPRGDGDEHERRSHQHVPFPPRQVPVARERDRDQRLREQHEGRRDGDEQERRPRGRRGSRA
jgi:hypothetical protein